MPVNSKLHKFFAPIVSVSLLFIAIACGQANDPTPSPTPTTTSPLGIGLSGYYADNPENNYTPTPPPPYQSNCQVTPPTWHGIVPGVSTKNDVIQILGEPSSNHSSTSVIRGQIHDVMIYPPIVEGRYGEIGNRIITVDGMVESVNLWVSNVDSTFHTVSEFVSIYGNVVDDVHFQHMMDIGLDVYVYVWSDCGIALLAVEQDRIRSMSDEQAIIFKLADGANEEVGPIKYKHNPERFGLGEAFPDTSHIVLYQTIYKPTSYEDYMNRFDPLLWLEDEGLWIVAK